VFDEHASTTGAGWGVGRRVAYLEGEGSNGAYLEGEGRRGAYLEQLCEELSSLRE
jgi:hypothetical protein